MTSVRVNLVANFAGRATTGVVSLALTPVYARLLGIEAYGLIGMFTAIQGVLGVLDLGLGSTLNQRLARLSASVDQPDTAQQMGDLVRTFEMLYAAIGCISGLFVVVMAPWFAVHLLHASTLPQETVNNAVRLMGVAFAFQWPASLYAGALAGLQRQVLWNGLNVASSLLRGLGALAVLLLVSQTVGAFFTWQIAAAFLGTAANYVGVWRVLPPSPTAARVRRQLLSENFHFAAHLTGSTLLGVVISQMDKFLLGSLLPLAELGYYTLATTVSNALYSLISPVFSATFPRLSQLAAESRDEEVGVLYHKAAQLMSVIILPPVLVAALFAPQLMLAWTLSGDTAAHVQHLVPWLVLGTALNGLVYMPYALQLSHGWSRFGFLQNVVAAIVGTPLIAALVYFFGASGAAFGWFLLNAGYALIGVPLMHRRLLPGNYARWLLRDIGLPLLATLAVVGVASACLHNVPESRVMARALLSTIGLVALAAATVATPYGRQTLRALLYRIRREPDPMPS